MRRSLSLSPLLVLPSLLGFTGATSPTFPNGTERGDNGTDVDADAAKSKSSVSLESYCSAELSSFIATYQSTEIATSRWTWYEGFGPTDSLGDLTGSVTSQTYWTSTFLYPNMSGAYDPPRVLTPMVTGTELATPTPQWGGRVNGDGDASPAPTAEAGAPSTTTTRPVSTGVTAVYESAEPSATAEDVSTVTLTANAVTSAIVVSGQHVGPDSVTGMAGAILSGLGGAGSGSESGSGSKSESDAGSDAGESASRWDPTQAVAVSDFTASRAIKPSSSSSGKKATGSSSDTSGKSSASGSDATSVASVAATQSGAASPNTLGNSAIWSFLAPILLLWI
ncbi:unnamed protein product [Aureobasidium vineae]|uniref:Uncharacterized protein n=1 Tax=Aureobasidium vineae TaxID=2773715 RepID=A0A9N8J8J4_9PEZI|nr:unnamed protein product [Aureobasidium vineae]